MSKPYVRCAIYTRKSSEEGLEQSFNSLEAQQEASRAYILSQKHEGWSEIKKRYDDGGFSGGTMERPALKQLLSDIQAGEIDTVIVYKVDRLTRSLTDFAKIIEILDSHEVSFVSVTQQFNTTTSMGRLTLNVLLSFAQFEREITGERIRDKVAASKKKGMWMGGVVPLGYDCVNHQLIVNSDEALTVRRIFGCYLRLGCVNKLKVFLDQKQIYSKTRTSGAGRTSGGSQFSRGALYHLLNNRVYLGEIVHRDQSYPGRHRPIVPRRTWERVAARLKENNQAHRTGKAVSSPSLLGGRLFDSNGIRLTPTQAAKNGKRYRYYTSQAVIRDVSSTSAITRFPAGDLEELVRSQVQLLLEDPEKCTADMDNKVGKDVAMECAKGLARRWPKLEISKQNDFVRSILKGVVLGRATVRIEIDKAKLLAILLEDGSEATFKPGVLRLESGFSVLRRGRELHIRALDNGHCFEATPVLSLTKALARGRDWYEQIVSGEVGTVAELARQSGLTEPYIRRILRCATMSPQIVDALLAGKHRPDLTLQHLLRRLPLDWREQENTMLGQLR